MVVSIAGHAGTPRNLRARGVGGGLLHKVCTLLQWNLEAGGAPACRGMVVSSQWSL